MMMTKGRGEESIKAVSIKTVSIKGSIKGSIEKGENEDTGGKKQAKTQLVLFNNTIAQL